MNNTYNAQDLKAIIPLESARKEAPVYTADSFIQPEEYGENNMTGHHIDIQEIVSYLDWNVFFSYMGYEGHFPNIIYSDERAEKLYEQAMEEVGDMITSDRLNASILVRFFNAYSRNEDIMLNNGIVLPMLREQGAGKETRCLTDFISPDEKNMSTIGLYALRIEDSYKEDEKYQENLQSKYLKYTLLEAFTTWMQERVSEGLHIICTTAGRNSCCEKSLKSDIINVLNASEKLGITLNSDNEFVTDYSKCGLIIAHEKATDFCIHKIGNDQIQNYSLRKAITPSDGTALLKQFL